MNIGLGVGAALGGLLVHAVSGVGAFQVLYVVDATTFLPLAAAFLVGPRSRPAATAPPASAVRATASSSATGR